jgi:nicotinate phosphoribosyltransferase
MAGKEKTMIKSDKPIIQDLLDSDFYKFTMGQVIFLLYPNVDTIFGFTNRTIAIPLGDVLDIGQIREEFDHVRELRFTRSGLHYLRGTNEYNERMFCEPYLQHLANLEMPSYDLEIRNGYIYLQFPGKWSENTYWEIYALSIIAELYARYQMKGMSRLEREAVIAQGKIRLLEKILTLKEHPGITFTDFGTRRRFSREWQNYVVETLADEFPNRPDGSPSQFLGTSNVLLAKDHSLVPMGTSAHEQDMAIAGILGETDEGVRQAISVNLENWWKVYGEGLSIALPDTFGSDTFFRIMTAKQADEWKGTRQDSGDPLEFTDKTLSFYKGHAVDSTEKLIVYSDGLNVEAMIEIFYYQLNAIKKTYGWGTNLTNDLGLNTVSIVVKAIEAMGRPLVKLSDNLAKAIGPAKEIARYKRIFGYDSSFTEEPTY